jgi:hypothetical protein
VCLEEILASPALNSISLRGLDPSYVGSSLLVPRDNGGHVAVGLAERRFARGGSDSAALVSVIPSALTKCGRDLRCEDGRAGMLTVPSAVEEVLPVFSFVEEAESRFSGLR